MTSDIHVDKFDPNKAKRHSVWLVIGCRNSGKSVLLHDLLYKTRSRYDVGLAMTATSPTAEKLKTIFPPCLVFENGYDFDKAAKFVESAKHLKQQNKERNFLLLLDDCACDLKIMKSDVMREIHMNGRHSNVTLFSSTQYMLSCPPIIRSNIDYVMAMWDNNVQNRKRLYEHFYGVFSSFAEFETVFRAVTSDYGCLVLDNTDKRGDVEKSIFWYRACTKLPKKFQVMKNSYYVFDRVLAEHAAKNSNEDRKQVSI